MERPARRRQGLPGDDLDLHVAYVRGNAIRLRVRRGEEKPAWVTGLDPLELLFLGAAWPEYYDSSYRFANACDTWLRVLRGTPHWAAVEQVGRDALAVSREFDLPVTSDEMYGPLRQRIALLPAVLRRLPRDLLPRRILRGARCYNGPAAGIPLPRPPAGADQRIARFWAADGAAESFRVLDTAPGVTALGGLTAGLRRLRTHGELGVLSARSYGSVGLLKALYAGLVPRPEERLPPDLVNRALAWSLGLPPESTLVPAVDTLLVAIERGLETETALKHLFGVPELDLPVTEADREWRSSTGTALRRLAPELA
jgi:hypothetical protein